MLLYHYNIISKKAQLYRASYEFDERYLLKRFLNERQESVNDKHQNKMRLVTFWDSNILEAYFELVPFTTYGKIQGIRFQ